MAAAFSRASPGGSQEMEALRPYDVAMCMLLRSYLCPLDESDPSPLNPLHALLGEALLREIRRRDEVAQPSLIGLLRNVQVRLPPPAPPPACRLLSGGFVAALLQLVAPPRRCPQEHICPSGEELSAEAEYFAAVKASLGQHLAALESPDDLVAFFAGLADSLITSATSAPAAEGEEQGADASSVMGLYLRMCYAQYTAAPFEASGPRGVGRRQGSKQMAALQPEEAGATHCSAVCPTVKCPFHPPPPSPSPHPPLPLPACRPSASCWRRCSSTLMQRWLYCRARQSRRPASPP